MFRLIFFIFFVINFFEAKAQLNYKLYYEKVLKGEGLIAEEKYQEGLATYENIFQSFDFIYLREYQIATQLALHLGDKAKALHFLKKGIAAGWKKKSIKRNKLLKGLRKEIKKEYRKLNKQYESKLNIKVRKQVKKMFSKDQWKALGALFAFSSKAQDRYAERKFAPHSERQMAQLLRILKKHGYPGEQLIGNNTWASTIISHHNSISQEYVKQDTLYPQIKPLLEKALTKGQLSPHEFAMMNEWRQLVISEDRAPVYGLLEPISKAELSEVNERRVNAYLRTVELRNRLIEISEKTGMNFYLPQTFSIRDKIVIED